MLIITTRGNLTLVGGVVKSTRKGQSNDGVSVMNVVIEGDIYNKDTKSTEKKTLDIAFWNSDDGTNQRADRVEHAGVGAGSFITAVVVMKDKDKAIGYNFKYSGKWTFPESINNEASNDEKQKAIDLFDAIKRDGYFSSIEKLDVNDIASVKLVAAESYQLIKDHGLHKAKDLRTALNALFFTEQNIFCGTIANVDDYEGFVKVTMPTSDGKDTIWNKITFRNTSVAAMADRAKKCLMPRENGEKVRAVIACGECEMYNGRPNFRGFKFDLIPSPAKK